MIKLGFPADEMRSWFIRIGKILIHGTAEEPIFSERIGKTKYKKIPFTDWRVRISWEA